MSKKNDMQLFGIGLAFLAALLLFLLSKKGLLHESVTSKIITPQGTVTPDQYGFPQFDPKVPETIPENEEAAIPSLSQKGGAGLGAADYNSDPDSTCPQGYRKFKNVQTGVYECIPS